MVLKVILLLSLLSLSSLSLVLAQGSTTVVPTGTISTESIADAVTNTPMVMPSNTPMVMPSNTPMVMPSNTPMVMPSNTPALAVVNATSELSARFNAATASEFRSRHFYCLNVTTGMEEAPKFPVEPISTDTSTTSDRIYWALFVQYPVLSYLDSRRKVNLLNIVAQLVQLGAPTTLSTFTENNFCIGKVVHYGVGTYQESLLINFYFNAVVTTPTSGNVGVSIQAFDDAFQSGLEAARQNTSNYLVQRFLERTALAIDSVSPMAASPMIEENVHPGASDLTPMKDPTLRAIVLGSFVGNTTINAAMNSNPMFGSNPRPINFGLVAGDIIFSVFGSLCITALLALVVLGFFIHPFFL